MVKAGIKAITPAPGPVRYAILEDTEGTIKTYEGVKGHGYREDLGGSLFYIIHIGGVDEVAAHLVKRYSEFTETDLSVPDGLETGDVLVIDGD